MWLHETRRHRERAEGFTPFFYLNFPRRGAARWYSRKEEREQALAHPTDLASWFRPLEQCGEERERDRLVIPQSMAATTAVTSGHENTDLENPTIAHLGPVVSRRKKR